MKKLTILLISLAFISTASVAQLTEGQISFGGTQADDAYSIVQTKDGGYAVAGVTSSYGSGTYNVYVANFSSKGLLKWSKVIGGSIFDYGYSIVQAKDGGFAIAGSTVSFGGGTEGVWVIKLDSNGNKLWTESIGGSKAEEGKWIINTRDGGFAVGGITTSFGSGGNDFYLVKLSSTGALQWTKTIGGGSDESMNSFIQAKDGGYAMVGYTNGSGFGAGNADVYVVKIDSVGNLKWTRTVGGPLGDAGFGICETSDKGYAVTGYEAETTFGAGSDDVYIIKLDSAGALKWTRTVGGTSDDQGQAIIQAKDNGIVVAGFTNSFGAGGSDLYLVKLNAAGTLLWDRAVGGAANDGGYAFVQTSDGGFAVSGYTQSYTSGGDDIYIVKFDSNGNTCSAPNDNAGGTVDSGGTAGSGGTASSGGSISHADSGRVTEGGIFDSICRVLKTSSGIVNVQEGLSGIKLYPNPCVNLLNIDFASSNLDIENGQVSIEVYDITGRVLMNDNIQPLSDIYSLNISTLSSGMYFLRVNSPAGTEVKKFTKE